MTHMRAHALIVDCIVCVTYVGCQASFALQKSHLPLMPRFHGHIGDLILEGLLLLILLIFSEEHALASASLPPSQAQ